jgi:hypothetical protein|tara:strand:- start:34137 stop:34370 length:234 start_codon:yes stop_codon:yes gene_type:complete
MQEFFVAMAIMGCGDAGSACTTLKIVDADFNSVEACHEAAPGVLRNLIDLDYPTISIDCDGRQKLAARAEKEKERVG